MSLLVGRDRIWIYALLAVALVLGVSGACPGWPVRSASAESSPPGGVVWSASHETGNMGEWSLNDGGGIFNSGTGIARISSAMVHGGRYSAAMTITNANNQAQAVRLFRWSESRQYPEAYYSAWYYLPQSYSGMGWWNLFQWKSKLSDSSIDPTWVLNVGNRSNGAMYFYLYDWMKGRSYGQSAKDIPIRQWFQVEAYYRQAADSTGQVTFWQDGVKILDVGGVVTRRPGDWMQWSINNYTDYISPSTATVYVDDAAISTARLGSGTAPNVGSAPPAPPQFRLGFKVLADLLGSRAGGPLENERHGANGDGLQQTTRGLMVWRKADNWTAFTDGYWTWVNGPFGLQDRSNSSRFEWERAM